MANLVPGDCFIGVDADYVAFPQSATMTISNSGSEISDGFIQTSMVPYEYRDFTGIAPEKSYKIRISIKGMNFSSNGEKCSVSCKKAAAQVYFDSLNYMT